MRKSLPMDYLKAFYGAVGAPYPKFSLVLFMVIAAIGAGILWWLAAREYNKSNPPPVESVYEPIDEIYVYSQGPNYSRLDSGWIAFHVEIINASLGDIKFVRSGTGHVAMEGRVYFNNSFLKEKPEFVPESSVVDLKRGGKGRLVFYQFLTDEEIQAVKEARRENDTSNTLRGPNHFNLGYITLGVSIGSKTSPFKLNIFVPA